MWAYKNLYLALQGLWSSAEYFYTFIDEAIWTFVETLGLPKSVLEERAT